jgi:excisionase family DNA binding protein
MLTVEEVKNFLGVSQDDIEKYLKQGKLNAYKIGGTYLRFRKEEVINLRQEILPRKKTSPSVSLFSRVADFWRFNNFYILSLILVVVILALLVKVGF